MSERQGLTIVFASSEEVDAQKPHVTAGGLFVPATSSMPAPLSAVSVILRGPGGKANALDARVVQSSGSGLALTFDDPKALTRAMARLRGPESEGAEGTLFDRVRAMSKAAKRQLALHGDRAARLIIMKDIDKELHGWVIQNPGISLDEIRYIAGYRQTNPEVLKRIAANRDWAQYPQVVSALVRNPKTPAPVGIKLLDRLTVSEQRMILRSQQAGMPVLQAIKRKLAG